LGRFNAMRQEYPVEQLARSKRSRFQLAFARMTMRLLPEFKEALLEPSHDGLKILATSEQALTLPGEVIRELHADGVEFEEPQVRLLHGEQPQQPIMWVRVATDRIHTEDVVQSLIRRGAQFDEVDWLLARPVVRARAPLRALLGYPDELAALTQDSADLRMWLSHYESLPPPGNVA